MGSTTELHVESSSVDLHEVFLGGVCMEGEGSVVEPHRTASGWDDDVVLQGSDRVHPMETVADEIDGFFDNFLYLANASDENGSAINGVDSDIIKVTDADLAWLQDPDVFMPTPANMEAWSDAGGKPCKNVSGPLEVNNVPVEKKPEELELESEPVVELPTSMPPPPLPVDSGVEETGPSSSDDVDVSPTLKEHRTSSSRDAVRREKVLRYLEKKKRRKWLRVANYKSRQRVANDRPRLKGRFLPLKSEFIPVTELQRRQRALVKQNQLQ